MENSEKISMLKALAIKGGRLTVEEKAFLRSEAEAYGLKVKKEQCRQCWSDLAVELVKAIEGQTAEAVSVPRGTSFRMVKGRDVIVRGRRINDQTLTDDLAEWLQSFGVGYLIERKNEESEQPESESPDED
ncbi:hypothetical protein IKE71_04295 [Candidatus Saccharibacteria bacterium]|nr:hypothetical protein [Candidatus Saccharibacteria bacterium]